MGGNRNMIKRKINVIIVAMLLCMSSVVIFNKDFEVEATPGGGGGEDDSIGLDYAYIWNITEELANVIYEYPPGMIPKGRAYGSWGGNYTVNEILIDEMDNTMGLEDVHTEKIQHITGIDKNYTTIINVTDFQLTINNGSYPYPNPVTKEESFVIGSGWPDKFFCCGGSLTFNSSFTNAEILPKNMNDRWPFCGTLTNYYINITSFTYLNNYNLTIGNLTYIASGENVSDEDDQYGRVFLFEDTQETEDKLENLTTAAGSILIDQGTEGVSNSTAECVPCSVVRINDSDGNTIKELLENGTVLVDDISGNLTLTYNLSEACLPSSDYLVIDRILNHYELWDITEGFLMDVLKKSYILEKYFPQIKYFIENLNISFPIYLFAWNLKTWMLWLFNQAPECLDLPKCKGFVLYDTYDQHFMLTPGVRWDLTKEYTIPWQWKANALPTFTLNNTVGSFLVENKSGTTLTGYANQTLEEETESTPAITAYNVIGNITIDSSPDDKIAIISNRYDGWWGQTPGDSGIGGAIVLGIAKYMKDHNIKPKYNLTFLFTTGEEYGLRGAWHYNDSHPNDTIAFWLVLDQLAFDQSDTVQEVGCRYEADLDIVWAIINQTQYKERTGYDIEKPTPEPIPGTEQAVFCTRPDCNVLCVVKDKYWAWDRWHRAGVNYTEGDSLKYTDRNDVNITAELAWNITKYFLVNPDCWFTNVSFEPLDSLNDGDTLVDSIRVNFTMNTVLPMEYVMLEVLYDIIGDPPTSDIEYAVVNYTVNSSGRSDSIVFSIPDNVTQGNYSLKIRLYNSTGKVNEIAGISGTNYNDSSSSSTYHLYHPFGNPVKGSSYQSVHDRITGSVFTANENGYADNITVFINHAFMSPDPYKCILYRANDSKLIGNTSENWTLRDDENPLSSSGWAVFNFSEPKPALLQGTQYIISCWGGDSYSRLYYDDFSDPRGRYDNETYDGTPPDPGNFINESRLYSIYCSYTPDNMGPEITSITCSPDPVGYGINTTISANVTDISGVDIVKVNIYKPQDDPEQSPVSYTMTNTAGDTYEYVFNDTWQNGQYNYTILAYDNESNSNTSSAYSFDVSAQATVSVCTVKDEYGNNTIVNVTDPPSNPPLIGYELLDDGEVLHIWNKYDSYYFNTSSGIQLTNHYDEYWSHNVLMLGYYNNDQWNLIYRTDELSGFNKDIESDNETFVNATLWKDLEYEGYDFRLAIRYHLGVNDNELTIIPYIKNIDDEDIPYNLGFAWEINDIQIDMTPENDYIEINGTSYYLNETLDETYTNMDNACFYIREDKTNDCAESLYLRWNESLNYKVQVKSKDGEYNAPVTLGIKIGTLSVNQEKHTKMFWHDASEIVYYFNSYDNGETWSSNPSYMVDGSTSNYASTGVIGDVELCDANNCSGSNLGVISKVELRSYGYYSGTRRSIILRPVFDGIDDGDDYECETCNEPGWSQWIDITNDEARGTGEAQWSWNEVKNLNCDVDAGSGFSSFTLYCSKVEMRVTYTPNNNPVISDPYPANSSTGVSISPTLNITVSDPDGDNMNITWLSNSSGSWVAFGWNNSVGNGTYHQIFSNASVNGEWCYWKVNVTDGVNSVESDVYNFYTGYESKIKNTGSTNISGYLLMQVQYYDGYTWVVAVDGPNETTPRTINIGEQFGLDTVFNGKVNTSDLINDFGTGTYRVYACFRDPDGDILICDDQSLMENSYEFTVSES
jgi:hypothetical protein